MPKVHGASRRTPFLCCVIVLRIKRLESFPSRNQLNFRLFNGQRQSGQQANVPHIPRMIDVVFDPLSPIYMQFMCQYLCFLSCFFSRTGGGASTFQLLLVKSRGHGCRPFPPRFMPLISFALKVQKSHCSSIAHRVLLTHAVALSASQFVREKKSPRIYTSMHSGGFELLSHALRGRDNTQTGERSTILCVPGVYIQRFKPRDLPVEGVSV